MDKPPVHCDREMKLLHVVGNRREWQCANQCGWNSWTGPVGELGRRPSVFSRDRACKFCGGALAATAHPVQQYHKPCRAKLKRERAKQYAMFRTTQHRPTDAMKRQKEIDLAGLKRRRK